MSRITNLRLVTPHRRTWIWMLPVLFLATLLAAQGLNADLIWYDELTTIGHAGGLTGPFTLIEVAQSVSEHSPKHSPLFFELLAGWGALAGWHHAVLRCLPLFFGVLTIAWVFRIGVDILDWQTALWASAFLSMNVFWLEYFHEIRMYTLQAALLAATLWHYLYIVRPRSFIRRHHWVGLILAATLSLYTQPFSIFVFLAIGIYHLFFVPKTKRWLHVALSFLIVGILYLPWLPVTYVGLTTKFDAWGPMPLDQAIEVFLRLFTNGSWLLILIPFVVAAWQLRDRAFRRAALPFWVLAMVILLLLLSVNEAVRLIPLRRARYFLIAFHLWAFVIAIGLARIKPRWLAACIMAAYLGFGFALRDADDYADFQGTIRVVKNYPPVQAYVESLRDLVFEQDFIVGFTDVNFIVRRGKHGKSTADYYFEQILGIDGTFVRTDFDKEQLELEIPEKLEDHPYLLFAYDPQDLPENFELTKVIIERNYRRCELVFDEPNLRAMRYVYHTLTCERGYQPIKYENGITIVDKYVELVPGLDTLRIVTGWEVANKQLLYEYNVSIQLLDAEGQRVAQVNPDQHLYHKVLKWYVAEMSTEGLPPGDYRIVVIVYDRDPPHAKVTGKDMTSGEVGNLLPITEIQIPQ